MAALTGLTAFPSLFFPFLPNRKICSSFTRRLPAGWHFKDPFGHNGISGTLHEIYHERRTINSETSSHQRVTTDLFETTSGDWAIKGERVTDWPAEIMGQHFSTVEQFEVVRIQNETLKQKIKLEAFCFWLKFGRCEDRRQTISQVLLKKKILLTWTHQVSVPVIV